MGGSLQALMERGTSVWLDDLSRQRLDSGSLASLLETRGVRGVTSNPSIFETAISAGAAAYASDLRALACEGLEVDEIIETLTSDDVRRACDIFLPLWNDSAGLDGRVSIEVDPRFAHDTQRTIDHGRALHALVARPNIMIKVPATPAGLPAIVELTACGISVNATLIFSVDRYREVARAYAEGLAIALQRGVFIWSIHSVASLFVSRVDSVVDAKLTTLDTDAARALLGRAAIANARLAWSAHLEMCDEPSWQALEARGAHRQRPLWASTGVKNPAYDDTRYVVELAYDGCVNTMPAATLEAVDDHAILRELPTDVAQAQAVWDALIELGIDRAEVCDTLEADSVSAFIAAWERLRETVTAAMPVQV